MFGRRRKNHTEKPKVLSGRDVPSLAKFISSKDCQRIVLMVSVGISTSAGIPDFRSPETGMLNLPHPEAVFEIGFFSKNPVPFYTLAHELYPGKFRPTIAHSFIRLLDEKSLLHMCFTQNIDTLERRAGVPDHKIIEAHGSFATQKCINCKQPYDGDKMKEHILQKKIARCESCRGYVKPDIVFFGEGLPDRFINSMSNLQEADLLIVMGTSLTVQPFASLAEMVDDSCPRVLINLDHVGDFGSRSDDVVLLGKCDDIVTKLCNELGWEDELLRLWDETEASVVTDILGKEKKSKPAPSKKNDVKGLDKADGLVEIEEQFTKLTVAEEPAATSESKKAASFENPAAISAAVVADIADKGDGAATHSKSKPRDGVIVEESGDQNAQVVDNKL
ncbi:hypothetical protein M413DRAFT_445656 [Hebeloma cylindrosporum]|uniref:Deacetylase sirtuin-type domain-containing protein n=1 Tax=Hebeloma cylindrosporum TaxID=76867 RepID=A0A0C2YIH9_HEBCY|nr:hypothetical protein M413DRAFT_445656 [Hebeloma cylindrosporum h7]